ncbi:MAG TPA: hypothetical protein VEM40_12595 [Nitrospirota bacterium]|nr:hypothetical protein [Nitrospirota bacterium]
MPPHVGPTTSSSLSVALPIQAEQATIAREAAMKSHNSLCSAGTYPMRKAMGMKIASQLIPGLRNLRMADSFT